MRCCILEFQGTWEKQFPLVEFAYNNSFQSSIQMAPYEALYGQKCRTPLCWAEVGEKHVTLPKVLEDTNAKVRLVCDR